MKLILPQEIRKRIESLCKPAPHRDYFLPKDLEQPLQIFIDSKLIQYNEKLFKRYKYYRGINERTLRFAWSEESNEEAGATEELRNLLCYFGFKKNWIDTLKELGISENNVIKITKEIKSKQKNLIMNNSEEDSKEIKDFAKRIYIELTTRKVAIMFDEKNDVIEEIYNSWYKLFCLIREEMKLLPVECFKDKSEYFSIIKLINEILNEVLRPHLTEHQAKFRRWFDHAKHNPNNIHKSPQDFQKRYPNYDTLIKSMSEVAEKLTFASQKLYDFIK